MSSKGIARKIGKGYGIEVSNSGSADSRKWRFQSCGNGYYKITPYLNNNYALAVISGCESSDNGAVQLQLNASNITRNQWFVYKIPNGLAIKARSAGIHNLVLAQKESLFGSTNAVAQRAFINDAKRHDELLIQIAN